MQPFRDERDGLVHENARLQEENERLRKLLEQPELPRASPPPRPRQSPLLAILVVVFLIAASIASCMHSCHRLTPQEARAKKFVVTHPARVVSSHGEVPFDTRACDVQITGTADVWPNCHVRLTCGSRTIYVSPSDKDCSYRPARRARHPSARPWGRRSSRHSRRRRDRGRRGSGTSTTRAAPCQRAIAFRRLYPSRAINCSDRSAPALVRVELDLSSVALAAMESVPDMAA